MSEERNFSFLSNDGKTNVHAVVWIPDTEPQAALEITHGMTEYIERYADFAHYLNEHGYIVYGHDHVGHGQSVTSRNEWGYFRKKNPSGLLIDDIKKMMDICRTENPDIPYFILGHSMGSFLLRQFLSIYNKEKLSGAIIMGSGYLSRATANLGLTLIRALSLIKGDHHRSEFAAAVAMSGKHYKKYDQTGTDLSNSWLSKDEEIIREYFDDPACTFTFTLNGYRGLLDAMKTSNYEKNAKRIDKDLPMLIISGEDDPVGDDGDGILKINALYRDAGIKDLSCKIYPEDRHEILNETDREDVYQDILEWMDERIPHL